MYDVLQSSASYPLIFGMYDSAGNAVTGLSPTVLLSKNGAATGSPTGAVSEIGSGLYKVAGNATDTNTLGPLVLFATGTGAIPCLNAYPVVSFNPQSATAFITGINSIAPPTNWNAMAITAAGGVAPDWANVKSPTTTVGLTGTTISSSQVVASVTAGVTLAASAVTAIWAALTSALTTVGSIGKLIVDNIDATISSRTKPADTQARVTLTDTVTTVTNRVTANVDQWAGTAVSALINLITNTGTASAGGASTITLSGSVATDSFYNGQLVVILSGTGAGQVRRITSYVGSTLVAAVERAWQTNPTNTSVYAVMADSGPKVNSSLAGTTTYQVLKNTALAAFPFIMTDSTTHLPVAGKTVTAKRSLDGAAFASCANPPTEQVDALGVYELNLAAADLNGNSICLMFSATGCDTAFVSLITQT